MFFISMIIRILPGRIITSISIRYFLDSSNTYTDTFISYSQRHKIRVHLQRIIHFCTGFCVFSEIDNDGDLVYAYSFTLWLPI